MWVAMGPSSKCRLWGTSEPPVVDRWQSCTAGSVGACVGVLWTCIRLSVVLNIVTTALDEME